jgi:hypothetical protein
MCIKGTRPELQAQDTSPLAIFIRTRADAFVKAEAAAAEAASIQSVPAN